MCNVEFIKEDEINFSSNQYIACFSLDNNDVKSPDFINDVKQGRVHFGKSVHCEGWTNSNYYDFTDAVVSALEAVGKDVNSVGYVIINGDDYFIIDSE